MFYFLKKNEPRAFKKVFRSFKSPPFHHSCHSLSPLLFYPSLSYLTLSYYSSTSLPLSTFLQQPFNPSYTTPSLLPITFPTHLPHFPSPSLLLPHPHISPLLLLLPFLSPTPPYFSNLVPFILLLLLPLPNSSLLLPCPSALFSLLDPRYPYRGKNMTDGRTSDRN